jgi:succinate dehydrogenase / fumarate reductase cytochrome b subunit
MVTHERPLSPHLQIYRLPLTAVLSFVHRTTGVFLTLGLVLLVVCLAAAAEGPDAFAGFQTFLGSWVGLILLWGWIYALFFHLCHGIRHLVWDTGSGLTREHLDAIAYLEITASVALTLAVWCLARII